MSIDQKGYLGGGKPLTPEDNKVRVMIDFPDGTIIRIDDADVEYRQEYNPMYLADFVEFRINPFMGRYTIYEPVL